MSNKTILVVDDEEQGRYTACQILTREGCTIHVSNSYRDALSLFGSIRVHVDLLVVDLSLPDGDGCDLALHMRDLQPDLRVLFVSGQGGAELRRFYGVDPTGVHFLRKPFTAKQFSDSLVRVLNTDDDSPTNA